MNTMVTTRAIALPGKMSKLINVLPLFAGYCSVADGQFAGIAPRPPMRPRLAYFQPGRCELRRIIHLLLRKTTLPETYVSTDARPAASGLFDTGHVLDDFEHASGKHHPIVAPSGDRAVGLETLSKLVVMVEPLHGL